MWHRTILLLGFLCSVCHAVPGWYAGLDGRCSFADEVYAALSVGLQKDASSFCLSYLGGNKVTALTQVRCRIFQRSQLAHKHEFAQTVTTTGPAQVRTVTIPDQTATSIVYTTSGITTTSIVTITAPDVLQTTTVTTMPSTITRTVSVEKTSTSTTTTTSTTIVATTTATVTDYATLLGKRGAVFVPWPLNRYAATAISSACSCLATPMTSTMRQTRTTSVPGSTTYTTAPAKTVTTQSTSTILSTKTFMTTVTAPSTMTATFTQVVTVIPTLDTTTTSFTTTTSTASVTTSATYTVVQHVPETCNIQARTDDPGYNTRQVLSDSACKATCASDAGCKSYSFQSSQDDNHQCISYTKTVDQLALHSNTVGRYYILFSNVDCP